MHKHRSQQGLDPDTRTLNPPSSQQKTKSPITSSRDRSPIATTGGVRRGTVRCMNKRALAAVLSAATIHVALWAAPVAADSDTPIADSETNDEPTIGFAPAPLQLPEGAEVEQSGTAGEASGTAHGTHLGWLSNCNYRSRVDNPHPSRTPGDVSVHGWWERRSGDCQTADVTVTLQAYYCSFSSVGRNCWWSTVDVGQRLRMRSHARLSQRANARITCSSVDRQVGYRAYVDVDINGYWDGASKTFSRTVNLYCVP